MTAELTKEEEEEEEDDDETTKRVNTKTLGSTYC